MQVGDKQQLIEKCPGYLIRLGKLRHFPVDTLIEPSLHDNLDTALSISIRSSHKLHGVTSGWWGVVMNRQGSCLDHHHTTTRGFVETVNRNLNGAILPLWRSCVPCSWPQIKWAN